MGMKYKGIIAIITAAAILMSGCGGSAAANKTKEEAESAAPAVESAQEGAESAAPAVESAQEGAESAAPAAQSVQEEVEPAQAEPELYEYNPHLYSRLLAKEIPQDHWDAAYNLIDTLRRGADTFECPSQEIYEWCMDPVTLAHLIPPACMRITGESSDGTTPFEEGTGRIYYKMPAEEYVTRQADFEEKVVRVLNDTLEKDDDDFEKCLKLYNYMESNYDYNYEGSGGVEGPDGYIYSTFMEHKGQCIDLAGVYAFLLRQAGVEALSTGCSDDLDHEWTYAVVNGQGYHIDPTWALKSDRGTDSLYLDYFMMSDEIRTATGCPVDDLTVQMLPQFWVRNTSLTLKAEDDKYYPGEYAVFKRLDEENKVLWYWDADGEEQKLEYGA